MGADRSVLVLFIVLSVPVYIQMPSLEREVSTRTALDNMFETVSICVRCEPSKVTAHNKCYRHSWMPVSSPMRCIEVSM